MRQAAVVASVVLGMAAGGGCALWPEPYHEVSYYDWEQPKLPDRFDEEAVKVSVVTRSPAGQRMLYREADGKIVADEYNKWVQAPNLMLERYLTARLTAAELPAGTRLYLNLQQFEINLATGEVTLAVDYRIKDGKERNGVLSFTAPFAAENPAAFAAAFDGCAGRLAQTLIEVIKQPAALAEKEAK